MRSCSSEWRLPPEANANSLSVLHPIIFLRNEPSPAWILSDPSFPISDLEFIPAIATPLTLQTLPLYCRHYITAFGWLASKEQSSCLKAQQACRTTEKQVFAPIASYSTCQHQWLPAGHPRSQLYFHVGQRAQEHCRNTLMLLWDEFQAETSETCCPSS